MKLKELLREAKDIDASHGFGVFAFGGTSKGKVFTKKVGSEVGALIKTFTDYSSAKTYAKQRDDGLTSVETKFYKMGFIAKALTAEDQEDIARL